MKESREQPDAPGPGSGGEQSDGDQLARDAAWEALGRGVEAGFEHATGSPGTGTGISDAVKATR